MDWTGRRADYPLDHAVIGVHDRLDEAARMYARLGFTLTPRGAHRTGSINHLMVFPTDYLELVGFPPGGRHLRPELSETPIGLDGLVLRPHGANATHAELVGRGFTPGRPEPLSRPIELDGRIEEARFTTIRFPRSAFAAGRFYFCEQLTPQYVWRRAWLDHPNGALGIERFSIVTPDPDRDAARLAAMLGASAWSTRPGRTSVMLANAEVEFVPLATYREEVGASAAGDARDVHGKERLTWMAMLTIRVASLAAAARALRSGGLAAIERGGYLVVGASDAMNCTIRFGE